MLSMRVGGTGRGIWDDDNQFEGEGDEVKIEGLEETMKDGKIQLPDQLQPQRRNALIIYLHAGTMYYRSYGTGTYTHKWSSESSHLNGIRCLKRSKGYIYTGFQGRARKEYGARILSLDHTYVHEHVKSIVKMFQAFCVAVSLLILGFVNLNEYGHLVPSLL